MMLILGYHNLVSQKEKEKNDCHCGYTMMIAKNLSHMVEATKVLTCLLRSIHFLCNP